MKPPSAVLQVACAHVCIILCCCCTYITTTSGLHYSGNVATSIPFVATTTLAFDEDHQATKVVSSNTVDPDTSSSSESNEQHVKKDIDEHSSEQRRRACTVEAEATIPAEEVVVIDVAESKNTNDNMEETKQQSTLLLLREKIKSIAQHEEDHYPTPKKLLRALAPKIPAIQRSPDIVLRVTSASPGEACAAAYALELVAAAVERGDFDVDSSCSSEVVLTAAEGDDHAHHEQQQQQGGGGDVDLNDLIQDRRFEQLVECIMCGMDLDLDVRLGEEDEQRQLQQEMEGEEKEQQKLENDVSAPSDDEVQKDGGDSISSEAHQQQSIKEGLSVTDASKAAWSLSVLGAHQLDVLGNMEPRKILSALANRCKRMLLFRRDALLQSQSAAQRGVSDEAAHDNDSLELLAKDAATAAWAFACVKGCTGVRSDALLNVCCEILCTCSTSGVVDDSPCESVDDFVDRLVEASSSEDVGEDNDVGGNDEELLVIGGKVVVDDDEANEDEIVDRMAETVLACKDDEVVSSSESRLLGKDAVATTTTLEGSMLDGGNLDAEEGAIVDRLAEAEVEDEVTDHDMPIANTITENEDKVQPEASLSASIGKKILVDFLSPNELADVTWAYALHGSSSSEQGKPLLDALHMAIVSKIKSDLEMIEGRTNATLSESSTASGKLEGTNSSDASSVQPEIDVTKQSPAEALSSGGTDYKGTKIIEPYDDSLDSPAVSAKGDFIDEPEVIIVTEDDLITDEGFIEVVDAATLLASENPSDVEKEVIILDSDNSATADTTLGEEEQQVSVGVNEEMISIVESEDDIQIAEGAVETYDVPVGDLSFSPRDLSSITWALTELNYDTNEVVNLTMALLSRVGPNAFETMDGRDYSNLAWSVARCHERDGSFLQSEKIRGTMEEIGEWALYRLGSSLTNVHRSKNGEGTIALVDPVDLSRLIWSFAMCDTTGVSAKEGEIGPSVSSRLSLEGIHIASSNINAFNAEDLVRGECCKFSQHIYLYAIHDFQL